MSHHIFKPRSSERPFGLSCEDSDDTGTDFESESVPSETSEDRDFVVLDTEHISEAFYDSDSGNESGLDIEKVGRLSFCRHNC